MAIVRTVNRGENRYYYLVQTYRWDGAVQRKERYLGRVLPGDLERQRASLEREVWQATWFGAFQSIHDAYQSHLRTLPGEAIDKEREQFVIEFTYDTNRIEGSTLTFQETADLLEHGISPRSKPMRDIRETELHASLMKRLLAHPEPFDLPHLLSWHKAIFRETKPQYAGRIRDFEVRIGQSKHVPPPPFEVRPMLIELLRWVQRRSEDLHPVERAAEFHFRFENIHPFGDGNGRIGRLAMNMLLYGSGYPMSNIQYGKRSGYYHALERSSVTSSPLPFMLWFFRRYQRDGKLWLRLGPTT
ncbi:MAG: Fic family protein [Thermoplasmata archaeon]|jgi:Fic family protein